MTDTMQPDYNVVKTALEHEFELLGFDEWKEFAIQQRMKDEWFQKALARTLFLRNLEAQIENFLKDV